jgi:hypothetical protein
MGWIKYLLYIMSFFVPPVGLISFWVFSGRELELKTMGKWAFFAAFIGFIAWVVFAAVWGATHQASLAPIRRF